MPPLLFWSFVALMIGFAVAVVINRSPVASALSLVVSFLSLAALFVGLDAYFIAVIQVLVYGGAVMVLFLFIIMLLDLRAEQRRKIRLPAVLGGLLVIGAFVIELCAVLASFSAGHETFPGLRAERLDDVRLVGTALFRDFNLPFQVVGVLVLVASIGVVVLSKRELK